MSFLGDFFNSYINPVSITKGVINAIQHPKETLAYWDDQRRHFDLVGTLANPGRNLGTGISVHSLGAGQAAADAAAHDFGSMSDQDLYRRQSQGGGRPTDDPFMADQYGDFQHTYDSRSRPRVYASDNSFVLPDTKPTHPNTALIPATGQRAAPDPTIPAGGGPEVTGSTATPGVSAGPGADTVANQFRIRSTQRRPSARTVA